MILALLWQQLGQYQPVFGPKRQESITDWVVL
jgi:hypothetical protein